MVIVAFLTLKMVVIMVFWYCMYITHVKLALPLHPELMFNENWVFLQVPESFVFLVTWD